MRDEIIKMAREAGLVPHYTRPQDAIVRKGYALSGELKGYKAGMLDIERFFHAAYAAGVTAERNAILQMSREQWFKTQADFEDAIRARGQS